MATKSWRKLPSQINDILNNAEHFNFMQLLRLLEIFWPDIKLIPTSKLSFPTNDINNCKIDDNYTLITEINFMGLYGVDSPLPHYFSEHISSATQCLHKFLNIFNNRIYSLLYQAWKKYHPFVQPNNNGYYKYLQFLSGNYSNNIAQAKLSYCGLFSARIHNSSTLTEIISDYLDRAPIAIKQFVQTWINTKQVLIIGKQTLLANNAALGNKTITTTKKITIEIGPLPFTTALPYIINKSEHQQLKQFIDSYLTPLTSYGLTFLINGESKIQHLLGDHSLRIGWRCWLGNFSLSAYTISIKSD